MVFEDSRIVPPVHYWIQLTPNLSDFTFSGITEITFHSISTISSVLVHVKELAIQACFLKNGENLDKCQFNTDMQKEEMIVNLPKKLDGDFILQFTFTGIINDQLMGFYRSKYADKNGQTKYIAVTQFEEREARRAFPCVDHPAFKATFDLELIIDTSLKGLSNTEVISELPYSENKKLVKFHQTPKMCTYLEFFAVGDFEFLEDRSKVPLIRVIGPPNRIQYGSFGLEIGRKSIDFCEEYTKIPYPLTKCDHIAVADFAFGAMENWGAVTYRENALLVYPGKTTKPGLVRLASVIAHETSHMWFGNLVSPQDWKYLWLNESFASYFTYAVPDKYFPQWQMWDRFVLEEILPGLERDAFQKTIPIEITGDEEIFIDASTAPIIYNKGAAILRMLAEFMGDTQYRKGIHYYLEKFKYQCATSAQFWDALEEATKIPVKKFAQTWVFQEGHPLIRVIQDKSQLYLKQERFKYGGEPELKIWLIPLTLTWYFRDGTTQIIKPLFDQAELTIQLPDNLSGFKLNSGQFGFYRVAYYSDTFVQLCSLIQTNRLSPTDLFGIQNDFFALVRKGERTIREYLTLVQHHYVGVTDALTILDLISNLRLLYLLNDQMKTQIAEVGLQILDVVIKLLGFVPKDEDSVILAQMRNAILWSAYLFGSAEAKSFALSYYSPYLQEAKIPTDIAASIVRIGIAENTSTLIQLQEKILSVDTPEPERLMLLGAIGSVKDISPLKDLLEFTLTKVPKGNRYIPLGSIAVNPLSQSFLWNWFEQNYLRISKEIPVPHIDRVLLSIVPTAGLLHPEKIRPFLEKIVQTMPMLKGAVDMALETYEIYKKLQ